jgi:hypothetical protein
MVVADSLPLRRRPLRAWRLAVLILLPGFVGCSAWSSWRMWVPEASGLQRIDARLHVEPVLSATQVADLQIQIERGRARIEQFYGSVTTQPTIVACGTPDCSARFGSRGDRAAALGASAIRLSHNGRAWPLIAHEWSHAEVYARVGGWWTARRIPRWFDEGLATVVADEAQHSPANWAEIGRRGFATPPMSDLLTFAQWGQALQRYGETRPDDPDNLRIVYSAAAAEVRPWLACAGPGGVLKLLDALREGADFDATYASIGARCR